MKGLTSVIICLVLVLAGAFEIGFARDPIVSDDAISALSVNDTVPLISNTAPRHIGVHDAGLIYTPVSAGLFSAGPQVGAGRDPETNVPIQFLTYSKGSDCLYTWGTAIWVAGIVGADTLVSTALDGYFNIREYGPEDPVHGGTWRTGGFADDEFMSIAADTSPVFGHRPLGLRLTSRSYTWADSLYDDCIIVRYTLHNIGANDINDGWVGIYLDHDINHQSNQSVGFSDDCSGALDTLLNAAEPSSRTLIAYSFDNDGDPVGDHWEPTSIRGVISVRLLNADFPVVRQNFNWWFPDNFGNNDFGPRRLGTPEEPLRIFGNNNIGYPVTDADKYYLMSHAEIDYDQISVMTHDSSDGWLPPPLPGAVDFADGFDTRHVLSFGSFDLAPGDSTSFTLGIVAADNLHQNPADFRTTFDAYNPTIFRNRLDFGPLIRAHRRADSVYASGLLLPQPGPPQGLHIIDYDDDFIRVGWWPSHRPDLGGYYLNVLGYGGQWVRASPYLIPDTTALFSVPDPGREYLLAVSLVDDRGRESNVSLPVAVIPGQPHPVDSLSIRLDGMTPELSWTPHPDVSIQAFLIYRAIQESPFALYDSTVAWHYRDAGVQSGVLYQYKVATKNIRGLESALVGPVTVVPMAKDKGVLFYSLNRPNGLNSGPFQNTYLQQLYRSAAGVAPIAWHSYSQGALGLKQMADYSLLVVDWERREDGIPTATQDSLRIYLTAGGRALFIVLGTEDIGNVSRKYRYGDGSFWHDVLKLDSVMTNGYMLQHGSFHGDLVGCQSLLSSYPSLAADTEKLAPSMIPISGYIPMAGYFFPTAEVEAIYSYRSSNPDTVSEGQINGIRYLGDDYQFVLLGFPLSLMREPSSFWALQQALVDLGADMGCGDVWGDGRLNLSDLVYLINYLYRDGAAPETMSHADVDHSGSVDVADAVTLINYIYRGGAWLRCP